MCLRWQKCLASFGLLYLMLIFPTMKIWQDDDGFCLPFPVLSCPLSLTQLTPLLPHAGFFFLVPKRGWNGYGTLMIQYCLVSLTFLLGAYVHLIYGMPQLHGELRCTLNFHLRIGFPTKKKKKKAKTTPFRSLHFGVTIILVEVNLVFVIFN